jgi:hypothetical protein
MERGARSRHDWLSVDYFQRKQQELGRPPPSPEQERVSREYAEDPYSVENLFGAAVEPNLTMATGGASAIASGLLGAGKGALYNPVSRALGGHPTDAADFVRNFQAATTYAPRSEGGKTAVGALASPFEALREHVAEPVGRAVEESTAGTPFAPAGNLLATGLDTAIQGIPQVLGGKGLGKLEAVSPREAIAKGVGGVSPALGKKIARPPEPDVVKTLREKGVVPTMGQRASVSPSPLKRQLGRFEEYMTRHPFFGAYPRAARMRPVMEHAYAQLNDARTPMGLPRIEPRDMNMHDALAKTEADLSNRYESVYRRSKDGDAFLPQGGGGALPRTFVGEMSDVLTESRGGGRSRWGRRSGDAVPLTRDTERQALENIVQTIHQYIEDPIPGVGPNSRAGGVINAMELQKVSTLLREQKAGARRGGYYEKQLVPYIERLQQSFDGMMEKVNGPTWVAEKKALDMAYSQFKLVQDAATRGGALGKAGLFSPQQTLRSVERRAMKRGDQGRTLLGKGQAQGQKLALAASDVLGNRVPDSGTPEALIASGELTGDVLSGAGDVGGTAAKVLAGLTLLPAVYGRGFQSMLQNAAARGRTPLPGAMLRGAPAAFSGEQRSQQYLDEQMAQQLSDLSSGLEE